MYRIRCVNKLPQPYPFLVPSKDMLKRDQELPQKYYCFQKPILLNKIALSYLQPLSIAFS
jgi:hypothetical protein